VIKSCSYMINETTFLIFMDVLVGPSLLYYVTKLVPS